MEATDKIPLSADDRKILYNSMKMARTFLKYLPVFIYLVPFFVLIGDGISWLIFFLALFFGAIHLIIYKIVNLSIVQRKGDLENGFKLAMEGVLEKKTHDTSSNHYNSKAAFRFWINGDALEVNKSDYLLYDEGERIRIFFAPMSKQVFSIERMS